MVKNERELWLEVVASWENYQLSLQNMYSYRNAYENACQGVARVIPFENFPEQVVVIDDGITYLITMDVEDGKVSNIVQVDKVVTI